MKNNLRFLLLATVAGVIGLAVISSTGIKVNNDIAALTQPVSQMGAVAGVETRGQAGLIIDYGEKTGQYQFEVEQGVTALELLNRASLKDNILLVTEDFGEMGTIVDGIAGLNNGDDNKYWIFYVNGQMASSAADKTLVHPDDSVEFRWEISPF